MSSSRAFILKPCPCVSLLAFQFLLCVFPSQCSSVRYLTSSWSPPQCACVYSLRSPSRVCQFAPWCSLSRRPSVWFHDTPFGPPFGKFLVLVSCFSFWFELYFFFVLCLSFLGASFWTSFLCLDSLFFNNKAHFLFVPPCAAPCVCICIWVLPLLKPWHNTVHNNEFRSVFFLTFGWHYRVACHCHHVMFRAVGGSQELITNLCGLRKDLECWTWFSARKAYISETCLGITRLCSAVCSLCLIC